MIPLIECKRPFVLGNYQGFNNDQLREIQRGEHTIAQEEASRISGCVPEYLIVPEKYEKQNKRRVRAGALAVDRILYLNVNPRKRMDGSFVKIGDLKGEAEQLTMFRDHLQLWINRLNLNLNELKEVRFFINDERYPITDENTDASAFFSWQLFILLRSFFPGCYADWYNAWRAGRSQHQTSIVPLNAPSRTAGCSLYHFSLELTQTEYEATVQEAPGDAREPRIAPCVCMHGGYVWPRPNFLGNKEWVERGLDDGARMQMEFQGRLTANDPITQVWGFRLLEDRSWELLNHFITGRNLG